MLSAEGLSHPLLPAARRVGNDLTLPGAGRAFLVTGSNMSGKSTLLRSIGLMQVMAWAGAPVCACAARISPMRLRTVVRVDDSVQDGVSHFYAELQRLKETLDEAERARAAGGPPVCYLLDEILHGTNTRERELGARLVIKTLCRLGATGAASTHDLSLASLEQDTAGAVRNVHFTESVHPDQKDKMSFDYVLRPGPVQTTNALRLMRLIGIPLDWEAEPQSL
jgi:DNA mismatch repair ATPase MutS